MANLNSTFDEHQWEKSNLVTITNRRGTYDTYKCAKCRATGKRFGIGNDFILMDRYFKPCTVIKPIERVRVLNCTAVGSRFENLTPNSEHRVVTPPHGHKEDHKGVWVQGVGEPVKLLNAEFEVLEIRKNISDDPFLSDEIDVKPSEPAKSKAKVKMATEEMKEILNGCEISLSMGVVGINNGVVTCKGKEVVMTDLRWRRFYNKYINKK